jgi:hypothetical protein
MEKKDRELLRVYDKDGQHKTLAVPNEITCADVVVMFGKKIHGFQCENFQLSVDYKGGNNARFVFCMYTFVFTLRSLVKSSVDQLAYPYAIAKELEAQAPDDKDRKTGVSKVKFHVVDTKLAEGFPVLFYFLYFLVSP